MVIMDHEFEKIRKNWQLQQVLKDEKPADVRVFCSQVDFKPDDWQLELLQAEDRQIVVNTSRQVGKSTVVAAKLLYKALHVPGSLHIITSPTERQSIETLRKVVAFYDEYALKGMRAQSQTSLRFDNGSRIVAVSGKPESVRGYSDPDTVVIDEAAYCSDDLFQAIVPMLIVSGGQLILISTPNLTQGFWWEAFRYWEGWRKFRIPATMCPRITAEKLEEQRRVLSEPIFMREFMCVPLEGSAMIFDVDVLRQHMRPDYARAESECVRIVRFWDLAITDKTRSSFTAGLKMGITKDRRYIILHVHKMRKQYSQVKMAVVRIAILDRTRVPIRLEGEKAGIIAAQELLAHPDLSEHRIDYKAPIGSKLSRALPLSDRLNAGMVEIVQGRWTEGFLNEASVFDGSGKYPEDQIDAASGAYHFLSSYGKARTESRNPFYSYGNDEPDYILDLGT